MSLPSPEPGLVISYAYLWRHEYNPGQEEGRKDRPCVIVLAIENHKHSTIRVTVAAITHTPPHSETIALEMPTKVKQHLGLDDARSWIILDEVNQFDWPGYDMRPVPGHANKFVYGFIPPKLHEMLKAKLIEASNRHKLKAIPRD